MNREIDVTFAGADATGVSMDIAACLGTKGFCVMNPGLPETDVEKALSDIDEADAMKKFIKPPELIIEGLMGTEGSSRIMEMAVPDPESDEPLTGLKRIDEAFTETGRVMDAFLESALGFSCPMRTPSIVHETGLPSDEPPELTLAEASRWMTTFMRHKLMLIYVLGPVNGQLELNPFDEDSDILEVQTTPGTMIIIRCDLMTHRHFAVSKSHLMSCYFMDKNPLTKHSTAAQEKCMIPVAQMLQDWTVEKMKEIKEREYEFNEIADVPASWSTAMNSLYHCVQRVAVRGMAGRYPGTYHQPSWFKVQSGGVDYAIEIPLARWNWQEYYDPSTDSWRWNKTFLKHGAFMDGAELFDNRFFGLSPAEAGGMDIHQREVLEVGYDALWAAGYKKGKIMNSLGGVYLGSSMTIFGQVSQVSGATGGAASINSNRFSFCLGMKGPSLTIDTESSASLSAVYVGCEGVLNKGRGQINAYSLSGGVSFQLGTIWWPQLQSAGLTSPEGRCLTFDHSACGYMMGDGCGFVVLKRLSEQVDGTHTYLEGEGPLCGVIAASTMNSNGMNASMNAPNGPAECELVAEAVRHAGISPFNVDAAEANGQGAFMADAVEVDSLNRVLRGEDGEEPLHLGAVKSCCGHAHECAGVMSLQKAIMANAWSVAPPNCHLRQLNPHMEPENKVNFMSECLEYARVFSYTGVTSRGFGGTNVHVLAFGECDVCRVMPLPDPEAHMQCLTFWPGGGGELETEVEPRRGYYIAGTFNDWKAAAMASDGSGVFGFTVTLGEPGWEDFQIYLDGDATKTLHPLERRAFKGAPIAGPDFGVRGLNWRITGTAGGPAPQAAIADKSGEDAVALPTSGLKVVTMGAGDEGRPGDQYRVQLKALGKYRTVTWSKVGHTVKVPDSEYFVTSNWNGYTFDKMTKEGDTWSLEVLLLRTNAEFQIARNADFHQIICPAGPKSGSDAPGYGPDDGIAARGLTWYLGGAIGEVYKITATVDPSKLEAAVSWSKVRDEALTEDQIAVSKRTKFSVVGSWACWVRQAEVTWGGLESPGLRSYGSAMTRYYFFVQVGPGGSESFQLLQDCDWDRVIHPDRSVDRSDVAHSLSLSPSGGYTMGLVWTIGPNDNANPGDVFMVSISAWKDRVVKVTWAKALPGPELDAALANNGILKYT